VAYGWGQVLASSREELGRFSLQVPPTAVEAIVWSDDEVTTVHVRMDAETSPTAASQTVIEF
jgi:hypothetical protein